MSQIDDYNAVLAIILAIPANQVKFSNIPIVKAIQEAEISLLRLKSTSLSLLLLAFKQHLLPNLLFVLML